MNGIPINRQHNIRDPRHTPVQLSLETYNGRFLQPIAVSKARSNLACTPNGTVMFPVSSGIVLVSWKDRWTTQEARSSWQVQVQRSSGVRRSILWFLDQADQRGQPSTGMCDQVLWTMSKTSEQDKGPSSHLRADAGVKCADQSRQNSGFANRMRSWRTNCDWENWLCTLKAENCNIARRITLLQSRYGATTVRRLWGNVDRISTLHPHNQPSSNLTGENGKGQSLI